MSRYYLYNVKSSQIVKLNQSNTKKISDDALNELANSYVDVLLRNNHDYTPDYKRVFSDLKNNIDWISVSENEKNSSLYFYKLLYYYLTSGNYKTDDIMKILYYRYFSINIPTVEEISIIRKEAEEKSMLPFDLFMQNTNVIKQQIGLFQVKKFNNADNLINIYSDSLEKYKNKDDLPNPNWDHYNKERVGPALVAFYAFMVKLNSSCPINSLLMKIMNTKMIKKDRELILTKLKENFDRIVINIHVIVDYGIDQEKILSRPFYFGESITELNKLLHEIIKDIDFLISRV